MKIGRGAVTKAHRNTRQPSCYCPHCKEAATARTSVQMSPMLREITYMCSNHECGHVFVAALEPIRTLSPSSMPDPEIRLQFARSVRRNELARALDRSLAEDTHEPA